MRSADELLAKAEELRVQLEAQGQNPDRNTLLKMASLVQDAVRLAPTAEAYAWLSGIMLDLNDRKRMEQYAKEAIKIDPYSVRAIYNLFVLEIDAYDSISSAQANDPRMSFRIGFSVAKSLSSGSRKSQIEKLLERLMEAFEHKLAGEELMVSDLFFWTQLLLSASDLMKAVSLDGRPPLQKVIDQLSTLSSSNSETQSQIEDTILLAKGALGTY